MPAYELAYEILLMQFLYKKHNGLCFISSDYSRAIVYHSEEVPHVRLLETLIESLSALFGPLNKS